MQVHKYIKKCKTISGKILYVICSVCYKDVTYDEFLLITKTHKMSTVLSFGKIVNGNKRMSNFLRYKEKTKLHVV